MIVIVHDNKLSKVFLCSLSDAAKIVGVTRLTLYNWRKKKSKETYNQFDVFFEINIIKQKPRGVGK